MRIRKEILEDRKPYERLNLEVLLDCRDLLEKMSKNGVKEEPVEAKRKPGRPKKIK